MNRDLTGRPFWQRPGPARQGRGEKAVPFWTKRAGPTRGARACRPTEPRGCLAREHPHPEVRLRSDAYARDAVAEDTPLGWRCSYGAGGDLFSSPREGQEQRSTPMGTLASRSRGLAPSPAGHRAHDCALRTSRRLGLEPARQTAPGVFPERTHHFWWTRLHAGCRGAATCRYGGQGHPSARSDRAWFGCVCHRSRHLGFGVEPAPDPLRFVSRFRQTFS
jgi:hypothetical protein